MITDVIDWRSNAQPWDICIGAGETPLMAYRSWESKVPKMSVKTPKHWSWQGSCEDRGKWRLQE